MAESPDAKPAPPVPAREEGQPIPPDAIDPELIALRLPAPKVGPLLSISIIAFCAYLMIALLGDLRFSREGDKPRDYPDLHAALSADLERFVRVRAVPDRSFAARVANGPASEGGHRLAPALGTDGRLWLFLEGVPWNAPTAYDEVYQGRLRRLDDLPFADELRAWVRAQPPAPHYLSRQTLLAGGPQRSAIETVTGDHLSVPPDAPVITSEVVPDRALMVVVETEQHPDEKSWRAALEQVGILAPGQPLSASTERSWSFDLAVPGGPPALDEKLAAARLFAVRVEPVVRERRTTWNRLAAGGGGLVVDGSEIPWASLASVAVLAPRALDPDARVLLTDETPERYWYVLPVYVLLALFATLFVWALVRALRPDKTAAA